MRQIPVHRSGIVVAWAKVDEDDYDRLLGRHWRIDTMGYARRASGRRSVNVSMHREILGLENGDGVLVDHMNGDKLDNRRENLRPCNHAENAQNQRKRAGGSSRYQCVTWNKACGKWQASIKISGKSHYLGVFEDEDAAGEAAATFRAAHMPFSQEAAA